MAGDVAGPGDSGAAARGGDEPDRLAAAWRQFDRQGVATLHGARFDVDGESIGFPVRVLAVASLRGGRGSVLGVLFGALIMASLLNGITLMAVSPEAKYIARGLELALAVCLDLRLSRNR